MKYELYFSSIDKFAAMLLIRSEKLKGHKTVIIFQSQRKMCLVLFTPIALISC